MMVTSELQAVILAGGRGSRLTELTSSMPKCLLPIGNKPMIAYSLIQLRKAKFKDVLIVIPKKFEKEIIETLRNDASSYPKMDFVSLSDDDLGTAETLREIKDKIKTDFLLISCDVITDFPIHELVNMHRVQNPSLIAVISTVSSGFSEGMVPGRKSKAKPEKDLIGIDLNNENRLVFLSSEADFEDTVTFKSSMLNRCPSFEIHSDYLDAHIYIFKKWVLKYLIENNHISSVKGELLPNLIKMQFKFDRKFLKPVKQKSQASSVLSNELQDIFNFIEEDEITHKLKRFQPGYEEDIENNLQEKYPNSSVKCYAYKLNDGVCVRANNLVAYSEACKQILSWKSFSLVDEPKTPVSPSTFIDSKASIGFGCVIGGGITIGERTTITRSSVGDHCKIGKNVKLINSVVMDHSFIEDGSKIQGSILCSNVSVGCNSDINHCIVSAGQRVGKDEKYANEVIMDVGHMIELESLN